MISRYSKPESEVKSEAIKTLHALLIKHMCAVIAKGRISIKEDELRLAKEQKFSLE